MQIKKLVYENVLVGFRFYVERRSVYDIGLDSIIKYNPDKDYVKESVYLVKRNVLENEKRVYLIASEEEFKSNEFVKELDLTSEAGFAYFMSKIYVNSELFRANVSNNIASRCKRLRDFVGSIILISDSVNINATEYHMTSETNLKVYAPVESLSDIQDYIGSGNMFHTDNLIVAGKKYTSFETLCSTEKFNKIGPSIINGVNMKGLFLNYENGYTSEHYSHIFDFKYFRIRDRNTIVREYRNSGSVADGISEFDFMCDYVKRVMSGRLQIIDI